MERNVLGGDGLNDLRGGFLSLQLGIQVVNVLGQLFEKSQFFLVPPEGCQTADCWLQNLPGLKQMGVQVVIRDKTQTQGVGGKAGYRADKGAAAPANFQNVPGYQGLDGLPHGDAADVKGLHQFLLRGDLTADLPVAADDLIFNFAGHDGGKGFVGRHERPLRSLIPPKVDT